MNESSSDQSSKDQAGMLPAGSEPPPVLDEVVVGPVEVRAAVRAHVRKAGVAMRADPRRISKADGAFAVNCGELPFESFPPLPLGDLAVFFQLVQNRLPVRAVADLNQLEPLGQNTLNHRTLVLPALTGAVVAFDHSHGLVFRGAPIKGHLEHFVQLRIHRHCRCHCLSSCLDYSRFLITPKMTVSIKKI